MARVRKRQAGFTLIEMMFVVAIIAVLAALAIPQFMSDSRKTKTSSEVMAFFAELGSKQEQYKVENGVYLATAACPSTTSTTGQAVTGCVTTGQPWAPLNVKLPTTNAYCKYTTTVGTSNTVGPTVSVGAATFNFTAPNASWYYLVAECDMDGDATTTKFFTSSVDSTIQRSANADD